MGKCTVTWLCTLSLIFLVITGAKALLDSTFDDFKGEGVTYSWSAGEATERGVLVRELAADPSELEIPGGSIRFGHAWIEERSLSTHRLVWFPAEQRVGGYFLYFRFAEIKGVKPSDLIILRGDEGSSVGSMASGGDYLCRVGGGAFGCPHAGLRPPLKRSVRFSRTPLSQRSAIREGESKESVRSSVQDPTRRRDVAPEVVSNPGNATA